MDQIYSINEILDAVEELRGKRELKETKNIVNRLENIAGSNIPENTLKLIEEAEKTKLG
tara:strand:+ start:427 stop:603 length:177 start_codon:yes stop_codon:yes gene_type:complete